MPPSQLKNLKRSLRDQDLIHRSKSKKRKGGAGYEGRGQNLKAQSRTKLQSVRDQFNPFEVKPEGGAKFQIATNRSKDHVVHRPGVTRGLGEEKVVHSY